MVRRLPRVAYYSHDTQGLGHFRRNLSLARTLAPALGVEQLLLSGAPEAGAFALPQRSDVVTLPPLAKDRKGGYRPRNHVSPLKDVLEVRCSLLRAAVVSYRPDLLVVDKVPGGAFDELLPAVEEARRQGTKVVLGLRDVLDDPDVAHDEWERNNSPAVVRDLYDEVWVYGDAAVYDVVEECDLGPETREKAVFTGYLGRDLPVAERERMVLCLVGGGQDGGRLLQAFVQVSLPEGVRGVAVCGPYMPEAARHRAERVAGERHTVLGFTPGIDELWGRASAVVSMAGYNSACDALVSGLPTLLVPRTVPRVEQLIRAEAFVRSGAADSVPLEEVTCETIAAWMEQALAGKGSYGPRGVDVNGHERVPELAGTLLGRDEADG